MILNLGGLGVIFLFGIFRIGFGLSDLLSFISLQTRSLRSLIFKCLGDSAQDARLATSVTDFFKRFYKI